MMTVEALFELRDNMSGGLGRIQNAFASANASSETMRAAMSTAESQVGTLKGALLQFAGAIGVVTGVKSLAENMIQANSEIETATKKLGGLLSGLYAFDKDPSKNFREGMRAATGMVEAFDDAESEVGIDKSELLATAQRLLPAFSGANKSMQETVDFTVKLSDVSKQLGQNAEMSSMYVMQMLQYGMVPRRSPLFQALGISREEMKKFKTEGERFNYLMSKLQVFKTDEMRKVTTLSGIMSRMQIIIGNIYEDAGKPLFNKAKASANDFLEFLKAHQEDITTAARGFGDALGTGLEIAVGLAKFLVEHMTAVKVLSEGIAAIWIGMKVVALANWAATLVSTIVGGSVTGIVAGIVAAQAVIGTAIAGAVAVAAYKVGGLLREQLEKTEIWQGAVEGWTRMTMGAEAYDRMIAEEAARRFEVPRAGTAEKDVGELLTATKARGGMNVNFNNNKFDIKQEFAEGFDPDRIAVAFAGDLARLGEMKVQSAYSLSGFVR